MKNIQLTPEEIQKYQNHGFDFETSRRMAMNDKLAAIQRMEEVAPAGIESLTEAIEAADTAREKAEHVLDQRRQAIGNTEERIVEYARTQSDIRQIKNIVLDDAAATRTAELALDAYLLRLRSSSPQNLATVDGLMQILVQGIALQKYTGPYVARLEKKSAELAEQIKSLVKAGKIKLSTLLERMKTDAESIPDNTNQRRNAELSQWFEAGFFDGLK